MSGFKMSTTLPFDKWQLQEDTCRIVYSHVMMIRHLRSMPDSPDRRFLLDCFDSPAVDRIWSSWPHGEDEASKTRR